MLHVDDMQKEDNNDIEDNQYEPWQITLMGMRLTAALYSALRQSCYKIQAEEQRVLRDMEAYNQEMTNLKKSLDYYEDRSNGADEFAEVEEKFRVTFANIQDQLLSISTRQNNIHTMLTLLHGIENTYLPNIEQKFDAVLDKYFMFNVLEFLHISDIESITINDLEAIPDKKDMINCLNFGYIREQIEEQYGMIIPDSLKSVCCVFYGNFIMDSNILNVKQMDCISFVLISTLQDKPQNFFCEKIFDSTTDETKLFNKKCNDIDNTITVIQTNYDHIMATISMVSYNYLESLIKLRRNGNIMGISDDMEFRSASMTLLLHCNYKEILHETKVDALIDKYYVHPHELLLHFPNDFVFDVDWASDKELAEIFPEIGKNIELLQFPGPFAFDDTFADTLKVVNFEVFKL